MIHLWRRTFLIFAEMSLLILAGMAMLIFAGMAMLIYPPAVLDMLRGFLDGELSPALVDKDFVNYWMGSHLVLRGEHTDLFMWEVYFARLEEEFGPHRQVRVWSYPPHILLPFLPLALMPYEIALFVFLAATFTLFVLGSETFRQAVAPDVSRLLVWAAIAAYALVNVNAAQNGFLTGALLLFGLAFRSSRPMLAGLAFGLLTIKPQLGLLIPVLLLIERNWATILWSAVFTLALAGLSVVLLGSASWQAFLTETTAYQQLVMTDWDGLFLSMMPTVFGAARTLGIDSAVASVLQWPVSIAAAGVAVWLFLKDSCPLRRSFTLLCATFLVSPYGFDYDMGALSVAAALMATRSGLLWRPARYLLIAVALLPALVLPLGILKMPVAPLILLAALVAQLVEVSRRNEPLSVAVDGRQ